MKNLNKKADGGLTIVVIVVVLLVFIGWLYGLSQRECKSNKECGSEEYCGSDFSCHQIPIIEKTPTVVQYDLKWPALIIGAAIVVAAIILKPKRMKLIRKKKDAELSSSGSDYVYYTGHED